MFSLLKKVVSKIKKSEKSINLDNFNDFFYDLEFELAESNILPEALEKIKDDLIDFLVEKKEVSSGEILEKIGEIIKKKYFKEVKLDKEIEKWTKKKPFIIMFLGFNGVGKTTTIAKLANYLIKKGYKVLVVAGDTFRAGSIEQLEKWKNIVNFELFKGNYGDSPKSVIVMAINFAKKKNYDFILIDTAGRSYENFNLMMEIKKIYEKVKPDVTILTLDCLSGSDIITQYESFRKWVPIDYIVMTKEDIDEKGGSIISTIILTEKKILFLSCGENPEDIKELKIEEYLKETGFQQ